MRCRWITWLLCASACSIGAPCGPQRETRALDPAHESAREQVEVLGLRNVQRTMRLLSSSTALHPNQVRVLFYGQSITRSPWSGKVEQDLRQRFPHADLQIQNRALGGYSSNLLVKTAETDLYPYYPDLVIFHVYGAHDRYEDIVRRLHERTTAEILLQTDHVLKAEELTEQTDPAQLAPRPEVWNAFMNNAFLPSLSARYQAAVCDQRSAWKRYLRSHGVAPETLLRDGLHLNAEGDALMADLVDQCLRPAPALGASPAEAWVETRELGRDIAWDGDQLTVPFEGNRVDLLMGPSAAQGSLNVRIDGRPPSEWPELYAFTRARSPEVMGIWPPLFDLSSHAQLLLETFTLELTRVSQDRYAFTLRGDKTGPDGSGSTDQHFESNSRRVVIEPEDWNIQYPFALSQRQAPDRLSIELRVEPHFVDCVSLQADGAGDRVVTIAQGLPNTRHVLELSGQHDASFWAIRVYRPPLARH